MGINNALKISHPLINIEVYTFSPNIVKSTLRIFIAGNFPDRIFPSCY